jgi:hypothetical protein
LRTWRLYPTSGAQPKAPFDMPKTSWKLSGHVDTVTITFQAGHLFEVELDAEEIDGLLKNLAGLRAMMQPAHPFDFANDENINFIVDPRWEYGDEPLLDQRVLRIRDPRFGWLHYVISDDSARKLADALRRTQSSTLN